MSIKILLTPAVFLALGLASGCVKSITSTTGEPEIEPVNTFSFATTRSCPVNLNFGLSNYPILIEVYAQDPMQTTQEGDAQKNQALTPLYKAITSPEGKISETMELPLSVKTVFLYTDYFGIPSVVPVAVTEAGIQFTMSGTAKTTAFARAIQTRAEPIYPYPNGVRILGGWDALGVPDYLLSPRATHPANLLYDLMNALPTTSLSDKKPSVINT